MRRIHRPSPALVVASLALGVALSGTAVAAGIVPLAKRALNADNAKHALVADAAKKLGPQSTAAIIQQAAAQAVSEAGQAPAPASTAAGLVVVKTGTWSNNPRQGQNFTVICDVGQKAISGGWSDSGTSSASFQSLPTADGAGWTTNIYTVSTAPGPQSGTLYAICLK
jgi:hypothetical protein